MTFTNVIIFKIFPCLIFRFLWSSAGFIGREDNYVGFKLLRLVPKTNEAVNILTRYEALGWIDLWTTPVRFRPVDVFVKPSNFSWFLDWLDDKLLKHELVFESFDERLQLDQENRTVGYGTCQGADLDWSQYPNNDCINAWMRHISETYPSQVTLTRIGTSYEGKAMKILWIHTGRNPYNRFVWIDAGIHAREWIGPASLTYMVSEMLDNYAANYRLVDKVDWYILPVANPDGYLHSWTKNRLWRKTRSFRSFFADCVGVDPNRNFGFKWREGEGAEDVPCSQRYAGPSMFSEPETKAMSDFLSEANENGSVKAFLSVHSYSQKIIYPWGYTKDLPNDSSHLHDVANAMSQAMQAVHGKEYEVFPLGGRAAGISIDWAKGEMEIPLSFIIELRDTGRHGFLLPDTQIAPTAEELWAGVRKLLAFVSELAGKITRATMRED